jgi:catechol-2,3-dioxygenase
MTNSAWRGQLSHIGLRVGDASLSASFYMDVLGLSMRGGRADGTQTVSTRSTCLLVLAAWTTSLWRSPTRESSRRSLARLWTRAKMSSI